MRPATLFLSLSARLSVCCRSLGLSPVPFSFHLWPSSLPSLPSLPSCTSILFVSLFSPPLLSIPLPPTRPQTDHCPENSSSLPSNCLFLIRFHLRIPIQLDDRQSSTAVSQPLSHPPPPPPRPHLNSRQILLHWRIRYLTLACSAFVPCPLLPVLSSCLISIKTPCMPQVRPSRRSPQEHR